MPAKRADTWARVPANERNNRRLMLLTDRQHRIWFNLLCLSAEQDERYVLPVSNWRLIAVEVGCSVDELTETLELLGELQCIEIDGDTLRFPDYIEREVRRPSDEPEAVNERVKRHRAHLREQETARNDEKRTVTNCNETEEEKETEKETEREKEKDPPKAPEGDVPEQLALVPPEEEPAAPVAVGEYPALFEALWLAYPRRESRESKTAAHRTWRSVIKGRDAPTGEQLLVAARNYAADKPDPRYTMMVSTFLNRANRRYAPYLEENYARDQHTHPRGSAAAPGRRQSALEQRASLVGGAHVSAADAAAANTGWGVDG